MIRTSTHYYWRPLLFYSGIFLLLCSGIVSQHYVCMYVYYVHFNVKNAFRLIESLIDMQCNNETNAYYGHTRIRVQVRCKKKLPLNKQKSDIHTYIASGLTTKIESIQYA